MKMRVRGHYLMMVLLILTMTMLYLPLSAFAASGTEDDAGTVSVSDWQALQNAINNKANTGKTIKLADISAQTARIISA